MASPDVPIDPGPFAGAALFGTIVTEVVDGVRATVKPAAVAAVATTFGFPLALMVAVLIFLVVQGRLDGGDPKLRTAPLTRADRRIVFHDEADL